MTNNPIENAPKKVIAIRSSVTDRVVSEFEHSETDSVNVFTAGYTKICKLFNINRVDAEERYYIDAN